MPKSGGYLPSVTTAGKYANGGGGGGGGDNGPFNSMPEVKGQDDMPLDEAQNAALQNAHHQHQIRSDGYRDERSNGSLGSESEEEGDDYYEDSDNDTEQPHYSPPQATVPRNTDGPNIRVGRTGTRANPSVEPMPPSRHSSMIRPMPPHQEDEESSLPPLPEQENEPAMRRVAGGLSRGAKGTRPAAAGMNRIPSAGSGKSRSSSSHPYSNTPVQSPKQSGSDFYRSAAPFGRRSDLTNWAPRAAPASSHPREDVDAAYAEDDMGEIENLPSFSSIRPGERTSKPITRVEKDMDWSFRRLLSENVFKQLLEDPLGRHRFRQFLDEDSAGAAQWEGAKDASELPGSELLDFYFDLGQFERQAKNMKEATEAIHDLYVAEGERT